MTNTYIPYLKKWITFLFLMLHINTNAQKIKEFIYEKPESNTGLKIRGLKGKIKSTKTCFFKIESTPKQGNIKRLLDPNIYGLYEAFNDSGKLIKYCLLEPPVYFPMNTTDGDSLVYNSKGKLEKLFYTSGTGTSFIKTYNNKEDIISNEVKNDEDLSSLINNYYSYKYNAAGKKTEAIEYSDKDKKNIDAQSIYKYDNKGRLIEQLRYGELLDFMIQKVEVPLQFSYKYDLNDNIIEESCFYKSLVYKTTYNYDSQNILIKHVLVQNNKVDITLYKNGVITQKAITDKNNYLENRRYKYEYDTNGNWIKLNVSTIISETGKKQTQQETLVTKEINYYE